MLSSKFGKYTAFTLSLKNGASATILPAIGAHLLNLKLPFGGKLHSVIDGYVDPEKLESLRGAKSSKLSPFPNRIAAGLYSFNGKQYQLPTRHRPNAIHGFVMRAAFVMAEPIIGAKESSLTLNYVHEGTAAGYPFPFSLKLTYSLNENGLTCRTLFRNTGPTALPYGDGWHPYFKLNSETVNNLELRLPACQELLTENMIPTLKTSPMNRFQTFEPIGDAQFDSGFQLMESTATSVISLKNPKTNQVLQIKMDSGQGQYRFFQLYIPPHRKSIAIEPMSCAADAFNNGLGLLVLEPEEIFEADFSILSVS